jgi:hypothetical protein
MYAGGAGVVLADGNDDASCDAPDGSREAMFIRWNGKWFVARTGMDRWQRWGDTRQSLGVAAANTNSRVNKNWSAVSTTTLTIVQ